MATGRVSGLIHRILQDDFVRLGGFIMAVNLAGMVLNILCRIMLGHILTSEQYGVMDSMIYSMALIGLPIAAAQLAITRYVATSIAQGKPELAGAILWRAARRLSVYGILMLALALLVMRQIQGFFQLSSPWPIYASACMFFSSLMWAATAGGLHGAQRFVFMGAASVVGGAARIGMVWLFIVTGLGASGALLGFAGANCVMVGMGVAAVWGMLSKRSREPVDTRSIYRYVWPTMAMLGVLTALSSIDMPVVKHFFPPDLAGQYARVGSIGRTAVFLVGSLMTILFPKVAAATVSGEGSLNLLFRAIALGFLASLGVAVFCTLWPSLPIIILHGREHVFLGPWVAGFTWAMIPVSMFGLVVHYLIAKKSFRCLLLVVPALLAYVAALWRFHSSIPVVIGIVAGGGLLCLAAGVLAVVLDEKLANRTSDKGGAHPVSGCEGGG